MSYFTSVTDSLKSKTHSEGFYTKEDIIKWLLIVRGLFTATADDHELDGNVLEETYNRNVAYGLNQIIKDLECMQK